MSSIFADKKTVMTVLEGGNISQKDIIACFEGIGSLTKDKDFWVLPMEKKSEREKLRWEEKKQLLESMRVFGEYKAEGFRVRGRCSPERRPHHSLHSLSACQPSSFPG